MANIFSFFTSLFKKKVPLGTIKFLLTGTADSYNITYKIKDNKPIQNPKVKSGWSNSFISKSGDYYYVSAQANNKNSTVKITVYYNDEVIDESLKSGDYMLSTVSGTID